MAQSTIHIMRDDREDEPPIIVDVASLAAVPDAVFAASRHYGGGTFTAVLPESGEKMYRMTTEWLDGAE